MRDTASWEEYYTDLKKLGRIMLWPDEFVVRFVNNEFKKRKINKVLEIGCGAGRHLSYLHKEGFTVTGTDVAQAAVKLAKKRLSSEKIYKVPVSVADGVNLPFKDASYDAVLGWRYLHVFDKKRIQNAVDEIYRVLKPKGVALISTRTRKSTEFQNMRKGFKETRNFNYVAGQISKRALNGSYLTLPQIKSLFRNFSHLRVERTEWTTQNLKTWESYWVIFAEK
ncbi:class I SAM-dependent methyltransferase [Candidatus Microgenomates bacterium]|nr:MAG: class I SAM-dependent methyltransferase [Candidatus Microgenomates bacterium]